MTPPPKRTRALAFRLLRGFIAVIAGAYLLLVGTIWYAQSRFIFHPSRVVDVTPADLGVKFDSVTLPLKNDRLAGWWVPAGDPQAKTLLYLHGNAANVAANVQHVLRIRSTGLNIFIFDYRGYGNSTGGPPREKFVCDDAERAWKYLVTERRIPAHDIVIYGHSLGGAVAIDLASRHPEAGALITESTLTSVADRADGTLYGKYLPVRLILTERFDSISKIGSIHIPKLIVHGEADMMAPPLMARRLYAAAADPKQMALIPGGGHEDSAVVNANAYFAALNGFLSRYHFKAVAGAATSDTASMRRRAIQ
jgi:pimeloyl-ACP methyl ester carboxylesterase